MKEELETWWASLSIAQKERIAGKGSSDETMHHYPACTAWWISIDESLRDKIYAHCTNRHGYVVKEWDDANPYGD